MKISNQSANGTSYFGINVTATPQELISALGEPTSTDIDGKVQMEWNCETSSGDVFTIYDWKESRTLSPLIMYDFHIGAHNEEVSKQAANEVYTKLESVGADY